MRLIREELRRSGFEEAIAAGVVITGGSAKMEGAVELAEEIFHMPVRLGLPQARHGSGRRRQQSDPFHRRRIAAVRRVPTAHGALREMPIDGGVKQCGRSNEGLVSGKFLMGNF